MNIGTIIDAPAADDPDRAALIIDERESSSERSATAVRNAVQERENSLICCIVGSTGCRRRSGCGGRPHVAQKQHV
jgi:hypothetical protein